MDRASLRPIAKVARSCLTSAIGAAEDFPRRFHTVADDSAAAVRAGRSHFVDRAFETVECMAFATAGDLERFVVVVAADFTLRHEPRPPPAVCASRAESVLR